MLVHFAVGLGTMSLLIYLYSKLTAIRMKYNGAHVLITGGSSGIGLELAKEYIRRGANVTIVARNQTRLTEAAKQLTALIHKTGNQGVKIVAVDVGSSEAEVKKAFLPAISQFGEVDVLINCAGTSIAGEFGTLDEKEFARMMNINYLGSVFPTRAVLEGMKSKRNGRIVFVSSQVAQVAIYGYTAYGASKWALRGLAEALQMELKPHGIYVSVAYPPDTDTPGYEIEMQTKPEITKKLSESGTVFKPNDVAKNIVEYSDRGYFGIGTGLDGWMLKNLHPGMTPINNLWEVWSVFYLLYFDSVCKSSVRNAGEKKKD